MKDALIIIDMQKGFNSSYWGTRNNPQLESNASKILSHWRNSNSPIFHIQHLSKYLDSPLHPNNGGLEFMHCTLPLKKERVLQKSVNSCFIGTNLEAQLKQDDIHSLTFIGLVTDYCVSTSVRMGANLGFHCTVISDATATFQRKDHLGIVHTADTVHAINLASLHNEFAVVVSSDDLIKERSHSNA